MKTFAAALVIATVHAVPVDQVMQASAASGGQWLNNLLFSDQVQTEVESGAITVIDSTTVPIEVSDGEDIPATVENKMQAIESVWTQIEAGFDAI